MKKAVSMLLVLSLCFSIVPAAFAEPLPDNTTYYVDSTSLTQEQREAAFIEYLEDICMNISGNGQTRGNLGYTKYEYGETVRKPVSGYPGNQPSQGYSFGYPGGTVNITTSGGPTATVTFSVNLTDYFTTSINVPLGNATSGATGYSCNIPYSSISNPVYYKVHEIRTIDIRPYVVYWRQTNSDPWQVASTGQYVDLIGIRCDAVRVA